MPPLVGNPLLHHQVLAGCNPETVLAMLQDQAASHLVEVVLQVGWRLAVGGWQLPGGSRRQLRDG